MGVALARSHGGVAVSALLRTGLRELLVRSEQILWSEESADEIRPRSLALASEGV